MDVDDAMAIDHLMMLKMADAGADQTVAAAGAIAEPRTCGRARHRRLQYGRGTHCHAAKQRAYPEDDRQCTSAGSSTPRARHHDGQAKRHLHAGVALEGNRAESVGGPGDMPASLTVFFGLLGRGWKLVASHRMQIIALLVVMALLVPQPANAQTRFHNGLDRHHFQRIERRERGSGSREHHAAERDRPLVEQYQWSNVRDSEHHARDLGLPAEYRLPTGGDQLRPRPGRSDPRHLQFDPRHLEHRSPQRDAREPAGSGERDSVKGRRPDRYGRRPLFGRLYPVAGGDRGTSVDPGCDRQF